MKKYLDHDLLPPYYLERTKHGRISADRFLFFIKVQRRHESTPLHTPHHRAHTRVCP
jgi:hypothetical protein